MQLSLSQLRQSWQPSNRSMRLPIWGGFAIAIVLLSACEPTGFRTPRPNLSNSGLNSFFTDADPSLSANGRYLAFSSNRAGSEDIYLYDTQQRRLVDLPNLNGNDVASTQPDISGDGRFIVYISNTLGRSEIFLYDRDNPRQTENISRRIPGDVRNPSISADGRIIVFETNASGQWDIELFERSVPAVNPGAPVSDVQR